MTYSLYHLPGCPYCRRVRRAAAALGIELDLIDVSRDADALQLLWRRRGRATVPVLRIGDELLGESADIIAYLEAVAERQAEVA